MEMPLTALLTSPLRPAEPSQVPRQKGWRHPPVEQTAPDQRWRVLAFAGACALVVQRRSCRRGWVRVARAATETPSESGEELPRRAALVAASVGALIGYDSQLRASDERYSVVGTILAPSPYRETTRTELVPGQIWGFEQVIGLASVSANIRCTVVRLKDGKLWVSAPLSPTRQFLRLLEELGEVGHLVLPSTALEHKAAFGEYSRLFPSASVWVSPGQYAIPLDIPPAFHVDGVLDGKQQPPWANELEFKPYCVSPQGTAGNFAEVAFFHKETATLIVVDAALKVPLKPPPVLASYGVDGTPRELSAEEWRFKVLAFDFLSQRGKDEADFKALVSAPVLVNPLLRYVVYSRCPQETKAWVENVAKWPFKRIIAAHLESPFPCGPQDFLRAFGFLFGKKSTLEPETDQLNFLRAVRDAVGGPAF